MTLRDELTKAVAEAKCIRTGTDWASDCSYDVRKHPECALAAFAVLPECEEVHDLAADMVAEAMALDNADCNSAISAISKFVDALAREFGEPTP